MLRRLFTLLSALSLLLCGVVAVMWVRGYRAKDAVEFQRRDGRWEIASHGGRFWLDNGPQLRAELDHFGSVYREVKEEEARLDQQYADLSRDLSRDVPRWLGFGTARNRARLEEMEGIAAARRRGWEKLRALRPSPWTPPARRSVHASVPAAAAAALPTAWLAWGIRRWMRRRAQRGLSLCRQCGYDLRATPGRCPECGIAPRKLGRGG